MNSVYSAFSDVVVFYGGLVTTALWALDTARWTPDMETLGPSDKESIIFGPVTGGMSTETPDICGLRIRPLLVPVMKSQFGKGPIIWARF